MKLIMKFVSGMRSTDKMGKTKQTEIEKKILKIANLSRKLNIESIELNESIGYIKINFGDEKPFKTNKKTVLSKKDKEKLDEIARQDELNDLMLTDTLEYEKRLISGEIKE